MLNLFFHTLFLIISIFILLKAIFYGIYEINTLKNKIGGIAVISFSTIVIILANIILILK